jgi:hypothetical protein
MRRDEKLDRRLSADAFSSSDRCRATLNDL